MNSEQDRGAVVEHAKGILTEQIQAGAVKDIKTADMLLKTYFLTSSERRAILRELYQVE